VSEEGSSPSPAIRRIKYLLFSSSIVPAILGGAIAHSQGQFTWPPFLLATLGLFIGQVGGDYLYFYFTHFHTDQRDAHTKIFAGWKPLFTGTIIQPQQTLYIGFACLGIDLLIALYFFSQLGLTVLLLALAGGAVAIFFTPLMLRGLKEPVVFITFGPLSVLGVYYVLTQTLSLTPILASLPIAFLVTLVAYLKSAHFVVQGGQGNEMVLNIRPITIRALLGLAYISLAALVAAQQMPVWGLLGLVTLPFALSLAIKAYTHSQIADYLGATVKALLIFAASGILITVGYLLPFGH
jgi:1,4-dihydroxy-2-naphthoate octaprenyltransferase